MNVDSDADTLDQLWDRAKNLIVKAVKESEPPGGTYKRQHRIQTACRQDKNSQLQNICAEVEEDMSRNLHQKIRSITKSMNSKTWSVENSGGETVTEIDAILSNSVRRSAIAVFRLNAA